MNEREKMSIPELIEEEKEILDLIQLKAMEQAGGFIELTEEEKRNLPF